MAGLTKSSSGSIAVQYQRGGASITASTASQLASVVGIVFQFPERHFLGNTIYEADSYPPFSAVSFQLTIYHILLLKLSDIFAFP